MPRSTRAAIVALATFLLTTVLLALPASAGSDPSPSHSTTENQTSEHAENGVFGAYRYRVGSPPLFACDQRVSGDQAGALHVRHGITCLANAKVAGPVTVWPGASLVAAGSTISGPVTVTGARSVWLFGNRVVGPLRVNGAGWFITGANTVVGPMRCHGNRHHGNIGLPDRAVPPWPGAKPVRTGDCSTR